MVAPYSNSLNVENRPLTDPEPTSGAGTKC